MGFKLGNVLPVSIVHFYFTTDKSQILEDRDFMLWFGCHMLCNISMFPHLCLKGN